MTGIFITFEGGEGVGKSTQITRLAEHFRALGREVVQTREPGGTASAEALRGLLVNGKTGEWSATAEALLNYAARESHLAEVIRPALAKGRTVLCDRFMDSTRAYQGFAGTCSMALIDALEAEVVGPTRPALTFILDMAPEAGLERATSRGKGIEDRYERKGLPYHQAVRQGFLSIAQADPVRCIVLDASLAPDDIWMNILGTLRNRHLG